MNIINKNTVSYIHVQKLENKDTANTKGTRPPKIDQQEIRCQ